MSRASAPQDILVRPEAKHRWRLTFDGLRFRCALGRSGARADKCEGDGATPLGRWPLRRLLHRPDRLPVPETRLPLRALTPDDAWCDDPAHSAYNRPVRLPFSARHERLWRDDSLYDLIVVLGYKDAPPRSGLGSAIFLHVARPDFAPTEGCVALLLPDLLRLLAVAASRVKDVAFDVPEKSSLRSARVLGPGSFLWHGRLSLGKMRP